MSSLKTTYSITIVLLVILYASCAKDNKELVFRSLKYDAPQRPSYFPAAVYQYGENTYSRRGFELGRKLFFDPMLSVNNTISCASCHKPEEAFADAGAIYSRGINGLMGKRHSPAIFNMAWNKSFMWDGGVNHIEVMPLAPLTNPVEMGEEIKNIVAKLNTNSTYKSKFREVFNHDTIDDQQMFRALALYMSNLVSYESKYDRYITGRDTFDANERNGYKVFKKQCAACHTEPLFTNYSFQNNGIDVSFTDSGRFRVSQQPEDMGKFKVPSLRNIAVTYPYMHNGRYATLNDVIEHYSEGVKVSPTLSPLLIKNGKPGLHLSTEEKKNITAFLHTLTDSNFIRDTYLREPY